jgi:hypothetical protein
MRIIKFLSIVVSIFLSTNTLAINYQWNGSQSTVWTNSLNWTPNGVPSTTDSVKIVTTSNHPQLQGTVTIKRLTMTSGTLNLNSYTLYVTNESRYPGGTITNGTLNLRGASVYFEGSTFDCTIDAILGFIYFNGSVFNQASYFEHSGVTSGWGTGGNTFNADVTIKNSSTAYLRFGSNNPDVFNGTTTFKNTGGYSIQVGFNALATFNGNVILENSGGGITFGTGSASGAAILSSGKTITIGSGGFTAGTLSLKSFTQQGNTAQQLTATGTAIVNLISSNFNGATVITSPGILSKSSVFNSTLELIKTGNTGNYFEGGNVFNGATIIRNTATNSSGIRLALQTGDVFNSDVSFITTTGHIQIAYAGTTEFKGNISLNNSLAYFNVGSGTVKFSGSSNQQLNGIVNYLFNKVEVNKTAGDITLNRSAIIDTLLNLVKGVINTSSTNLLTLKASSTTTGGNNTSFISGPLRKIGNTAYVFPVGKGILTRTIKISSLNSVSDSYTVEYFNNGYSNTTLSDTTIAQVNDCEYWSVQRNSGATSPILELNWSKNSCLYNSANRMLGVSLSSGQSWVKSTTINSNGDINSGSISISFVPNVTSYTLATLSVSNFNRSLSAINAFSVFAIDTITAEQYKSSIGKLGAKNYVSNVFGIDTLFETDNSYQIARDSLLQFFSDFNSNKLTIVSGSSTLNLTNGGCYRLIGDTLSNVINITGDSLSKYYIKLNNKVFLKQTFVINCNGVSPSNIYLISNDINIDSLQKLNCCIITNKLSLPTIYDLRAQLVSISNLKIFGGSTNEAISFFESNKVKRSPLPCNVPFDGCNYLANGDLEIETSLGMINTLGNLDNSCECWGPDRVGTGCNPRNDNTPDYFSTAASPSIFNNNCSQTPDMGIPVNFNSNGNVNVRIPGSSHYFSLLQNEASMTYLARPLERDACYLFEFYSTKEDCSPQPAHANYCLSLSDNSGTIANAYTLRTGVSFTSNQNNSSSWYQNLTHFDTFGPSPSFNFNTSRFFTFKYNRPAPPLPEFAYMLDDFKILRTNDAGPDRLTCGGPVNIGPITDCLTSIPNLIVSFLWTASPAYAWTNGDQFLLNPSVIPTVTTTFSLEVTIAYPDGYTQVCSDDCNVIVGSGSNLTFNITPSYSSCISQPDLTVNIISGVPPYTFIWSTGSTNQTISNVAPGSYSVTVNDANGCSSTQTFQVSQHNPINLTISQNPTPVCFGQLASLTATPSGGFFPFTYSWSTGATTSTVNGLGAGTYTCTVTDNIGCTKTQSYQVNVSTAISLAFNQTPNPICTNQTTGVSVVAIGGTPSYTYLWSTNATSSNISNISPGTYTVTVTDQSGCTSTSSYSIVTSVVTATVTSNTVNPCQVNSGLVSFSLVGTPPYNYSWVNSTNGNTGNGTTLTNSLTLNSLSSGNYSITFISSLGCSTIRTFTVATVTGIPSVAIVPQPELNICQGSTISLNAIGTPVLGGSYSWTSLNGTTILNNTSSTASATIVRQEVFTVKYTANNGCTATSSTSTINIISLPPAPVIIAPISNCEDNTICFVESPVSGMSYSWVASNPNGTVDSDKGNSMNINPNWIGPLTITFTVTSNTTGCSRSSSVFIARCCEGDVLPASNLELDFSNMNWSDLRLDADFINAGVIQTDPNTSLSILSTRIGGSGNPVLTASINGTFTIDEDLFMEYSDIIMGPNARIIVNPGVRFVFGEGNHLHSCGDYMWQGIEAINPANTDQTFIYVGTGTVRIEEALLAINVSPPAALQCETGNIIFNRNFRNINISPTTSPLTASNFSNLDKIHIEGCNFSCQTNGQYSTIGVRPHINDRTSEGIAVRNIRSAQFFSPQPLLTIGDGINITPGGAHIPNVFSNMDFGIQVFNSDVHIQRNTFLNLNDDIVSPRMNCVGINISSRNYAGNVIIGGNLAPGELQSNIFTNCKRGINVNLSLGSLTVFANLFQRCPLVGIRSVDNLTYNLNINTNDFLDNGIGIRTLNTGINGTTNLFNISNNTFNLTRYINPLGPEFDGIQVENAVLNNNQNITISNNFFGTIGLLLPVRGEFRNAIFLNQISRATLSNNNFHYDDVSVPTNAPQSGIRMEFCNACTISNSQFVRNGILIPNSRGVFATNCLANNSFINNSFHGIARGFNSNFCQQFLTLQCNNFVNNSQAVYNNSSNFGQQGSPINASGNSWITCQTQVTAVNGFTPSMWFVQSLTGNFAPTVQVPPLPSNWSAQLPAVPALPPSPSCDPDPCPNCRLLAATNVLNMLNQVNNFSDVEIELMEDGLFTTIYIDSTILYNNLGVDSNLIDFFHNFKLQERGQMFELLQNYIKGDTAVLSASMPIFNNNSTSFSNYKIVAQYLKAVFDNDTLTMSDLYPRIESLALSNMYVDGGAVFSARAISGLLGDDEYGNNLRVLSENINSLSKQNQFNIFPNPTNGILNIQSKIEINAIDLIDLYGRTVFSKQSLSTNQFNLNLEDLGIKSGIYLLKLNNNATLVQKVNYLR